MRAGVSCKLAPVTNSQQRAYFFYYLSPQDCCCAPRRLLCRMQRSCPISVMLLQPAVVGLQDIGSEKSVSMLFSPTHHAACTLIEQLLSNRAAVVQCWRIPWKKDALCAANCTALPKVGDLDIVGLAACCHEVSNILQQTSLLNQPRLATGMLSSLASAPMHCRAAN